MDFHESVRVIWPGEVGGVIARAVNLSLAGMLIDAPTPTPCPVGSDVLCDVSLPRGPRLLRGRVAHRRVLPSAKVGMGIEFVDLSPREVAELRDVVHVSVTDGSAQPLVQRVKVRFEGTNQVVRARAFSTEDGLRLATSLPFLRLDTEVDIALSPDGAANARGWVSGVALEHDTPGGAPRLLIDVRVDGREARDRANALTPVVEPLSESRSELPSELPDEPSDELSNDVTPIQAVPEHVWEPDELDVTAEAPPLGLPGDLDEPVPVSATAAPSRPTVVELGAAPLREDADLTEIVALAPPRSGRWRALGGGMIAGAMGLAVLVAAIVLANAVGLRMPSRTPVVAAPAPVAPPPAPEVAAAAPAAPAAREPRVAAPEEAPAEPVEPVSPVSPVLPALAPADSSVFTVGLTGSIAGAQRYPLRSPDGVAFNLPHARATMKLGTYRPDVRGLKLMWVRALPGGGAHLRFFFASPRAAPRIDLDRDAVRVTPSR